MVGAQDYALFRLCFCEGHRTLLPPSCHLVQKRECNVDAPLGPEQDLKLLFPCNPQGSPSDITKNNVGLCVIVAILWAVGLPLHLAVPPHTPHPTTIPFPSQLAMCRLPPEGVPPACTWRVERGRGRGSCGWRTGLCSLQAMLL